MIRRRLGVGSIDPRFEAYQDAWFQKIEKFPFHEQFDEATSYVIVKVAEFSPGAALGLEPNDNLVSIDGHPAASVNVLDYIVDKSEVTYLFYDFSEHAYIRVLTNAVPLGVVAEASSVGIVQRCRNEGYYGWSDLILLWKRRSWDRLKEAAYYVGPRTILDKSIRFFFKDYGDSAEILFHGAALYETGQQEEGIELVSKFINEMLMEHETPLHAIAFFYAAKWGELNGSSEDYDKWLLEADNNNGGQFDRITQEVTFKKHAQPMLRYRWDGKEFPLRYDLPVLGQDQNVALDEQLMCLNGKELLPLCIMPGYRGNGPYNDAMCCYRSIYKFASQWISPLTVIVDETKERSDRKWWYFHEKQAMAEGIPMAVLFDKGRTVAKALELKYSPVFYLLDKQANIVFEGELRGSFDYWNAISSIMISNSEKA